MATRSNLPKIVTDIQDVVSEIGKDFESSNSTPITDDNHGLHKLCAKLEFLLTSSLKEKSLLGGKRSYWHWFNTCLRSAKGLNDGIRYVQANKELQSSKGKGRAFIRYCLVHQTLADSLQNCIMNESISNQQLSPDSVLLNSTFSSAIVTSLYDLNAINFDLNSKGYDLDSGWPTFASKRNTSIVDQWGIQSHISSLGSASVVMETPNLHGSGSSAPSSVDQRIEELVLELDQSDNRIKEQQDMIMDLELKADSISKATNEKEDILTRVISDLESKNRRLEDALSEMSSEYENREQTWSEKHDKVSKERNVFDATNANLLSKIEQLEEDKRTLEELVSQHMSTITSNFSSNSDNVTNSPLTPSTSTPLYNASKNTQNKSCMEKLRKENEILSIQLQESQKQSVEMKIQINESLSNAYRMAELEAELETGQDKVAILENKLPEFQLKVDEERDKVRNLENAAEALSSSHEFFIQRLKDILGITDVDGADQIELILEFLAKSKGDSTNIDNLQQSDNSYNSSDMKSLKDEIEALNIDFNSAKLDAEKYKQKLQEAQIQLESLKLELTSERTKSTSHAIEQEELLSISKEECEKQQRQHAEILTDLETGQEKLRKTEEELLEMKQKYLELEQKASELNEENERIHQQYEDEICDNEFVMEELQAEVQCHSSINDTLDHDLQKEKAKCSKISGDLIIANKAIEKFSESLSKHKTKLSRTEEIMLQFQKEMKVLTIGLTLNEKQLSTLMKQVEEFFQNMRSIDDTVIADEFVVIDGENGLTPEEETALNKKMLMKNMQENFKAILDKYKTTKSDLNEVEIKYSTLCDESESRKQDLEIEVENLRNALSETQSNVDIYLITIKDLSDKHKVLQDAKANYHDRVDKLEYENQELSQTLEATKAVSDELRLRVMEGSTKCVELQDQIETQNDDITNLKEKVTQLLRDKDSLWKDTEELREKLAQKSELDESVWVDDDDVTACTACDESFTLTLRRHHCRICGKIFCKNCCCLWVTNENKKLRTCIECFQKRKADDGDPISSTFSPDTSINSESNADVTTSEYTSSSVVVSPSRESEKIPVDEPSSVKDESDTSIYKSTYNESVKSEDTVNVPARKAVHLPVYIEEAGIVLHWEITSDRDINFKLCYSPTEDDEPQDIMPLKKIQSHIEPFIGELEARREGVYSLVLDNKFSRFNSKQVVYKLRTVLNS